MDISMEQAAIEEQVTVVGQTPVIDTKKTQVGVNITEEMIMSLPTSRNPWVLMALAPGMMIDREDVGGNEGGQQSSYYGHGSASGDSTWNVDGANITDNSALGAAPAYLNMSGLRRDADQLRQQRRSRPRPAASSSTSSPGAAATGSPDLLSGRRRQGLAVQQPARRPEVLRGYKGAGVNKIYLYGANFGGPIIKDKAWFYGSYGIQDIGTITLAGTNDNTWLASGYAKLDFQMAPEHPRQRSSPSTTTS